MPYNTRRKSLSLPSLGVHVPLTMAQRAVVTNSITKSADKAPARLRRSAPSDSEDEPQAKRLKRSAGRSFSRNDGMAPSRTGGKVKVTSVPWGDVDDEVVRAAMEQLHISGNRPHLIKEITELISSKLNIMKQSANPSAIVASRLSGFIKRSSWTPKSPCPIGKELETVHPRRTYFFLTTCPRLPIPAASTASNEVSESNMDVLSSPEDSSDASAASDEESDGDDDDVSTDQEERRERSLSPEVDLSSPELDSADDVEDIDSDAHSQPWLKYRRGRGPPPPLEKDEHEFTQTATGLQNLKFDGSDLPSSSYESSESESELAFIDDLPKYDLWANEPRVSGLMSGGPSSSGLHLKEQSSPQKKDTESDHWVPLGLSLASWDYVPQTINLDELDSMF